MSPIAQQPACHIKKLGVIGAGVMGQAIIRGLQQSETVQIDQIWAATHRESSRQSVEELLGIACYTEYAGVLPATDVLLLCVKPSGLPGVLKQLKQSGLSETTLIISIVAGVTLQSMAQYLGNPNPLIRAMTNTPCLVRQAMTAVCAQPNVSQQNINLAMAIFSAVGECIQLDESLFDAVTGLSGSGPAYVYLIMEALADGGVRVGLPRKAALKIVTQTLLGAATMVQNSSHHPAALRDDVTTPAGCTIGALLTLEDGKIRSVLARAVEEATRIAGELGKTEK
jgi:pyrroline-5-carboxylate reductase